MVASVFAKTAEVDLINPDEPEADLGDASDANSHSNVTMTQNPAPYIWSNIGHEFIPFTGGRGSFKQQDTVGGLMLWGAQLVTNGVGCVAAYYGVINCWDYLNINGYTSNSILSTIASSQAMTAEEYQAQYEETGKQMKIFGAITLGCFIGETALAIARPICVAKKNTKTATINQNGLQLCSAQNGAYATTVSIVPVITPNAYGALAVVRY